MRRLPRLHRLRCSFLVLVKRDVTQKAVQLLPGRIGYYTEIGLFAFQGVGKGGPVLADVHRIALGELNGIGGGKGFRIGKVELVECSYARWFWISHTGGKQVNAEHSQGDHTHGQIYLFTGHPDCKGNAPE